MRTGKGSPQELIRVRYICGIRSASERGKIGEGEGRDGRPRNLEMSYICAVQHGSLYPSVAVAQQSTYYTARARADWIFNFILINSSTMWAPSWTGQL